MQSAANDTDGRRPAAYRSGAAIVHIHSDGPKWRWSRESIHGEVSVKNIQVIDGAENCTYSLFGASDRDFAALFPRGADVGFPDEIRKRLGTRRSPAIFGRLWRRPVDKKTVRGIHGTLFYGLDFKKKLYPTRREVGMDPRSFNAAQRRLLGLQDGNERGSGRE